MSIEVIKKVTEIEEIAQENRLKAVEKAKKTVSDAERAGQELLVNARSKAEGKAKILMAKAEAKAAENERDVINETARVCDTLRLSAEKRLPEAAELIVRRVVNV